MNSGYVDPAAGRQLLVIVADLTAAAADADPFGRGAAGVLLGHAVTVDPTGQDRADAVRAVHRAAAELTQHDGTP